MQLLKINLGLILITTLLFSACKKEEEKENTPEYINTSFAAGINDTLIAAGTISGSGNYAASGNVKVYKDDNIKVLRFENFQTENGPSLNVYLSRTTDFGDVIYIDPLQAISGNFNYVFSINTDVTDYKYVLVYDNVLNKLFGYAELQ